MKKRWRRLRRRYDAWRFWRSAKPVDPDAPLEKRIRPMRVSKRRGWTRRN